MTERRAGYLEMMGSPRLNTLEGVRYLLCLAEFDGVGDFICANSKQIIPIIVGNTGLELNKEQEQWLTKAWEEVLLKEHIGYRMTPAGLSKFFFGERLPGEYITWREIRERYGKREFPLPLDRKREVGIKGAWKPCSVEFGLYFAFFQGRRGGLPPYGNYPLVLSGDILGEQGFVTLPKLSEQTGRDIRSVRSFVRHLLGSSRPLPRVIVKEKRGCFSRIVLPPKTAKEVVGLSNSRKKETPGERQALVNYVRKIRMRDSNAPQALAVGEPPFSLPTRPLVREDPSLVRDLELSEEFVQRLIAGEVGGGRNLV